VLYIEDDGPSLQLVAHLLEQRPGVELLTATEGRMGATLARERRPAVILLDLYLQDVEAEEVLRAIRDEPELRSIPVILVTAEPYPRLPHRWQAAGAQAYLKKPIEFARFFALLDTYLAASGDPASPFHAHPDAAAP
jgi:two-component system cell cycle response regulator DivK